MFSLNKEINNVEITCNLHNKTVDILKQYSNVPHGLSLIALFLIDTNNKELDMQISYPFSTSLSSVLDSLFSVWLKYEPIKSFIRSVKKDGTFLSEIDSIKLYNNDDFPLSEDDFNGKQVIIDVELKDQEYTVTLYRWSEAKARKLKLLHKA